MIPRLTWKSILPQVHGSLRIIDIVVKVFKKRIVSKESAGGSSTYKKSK